jgi:hypothetical protein
VAKSEPYLRKSDGVSRENGQRVVSNVIYVLKHGLQRKDAPHEDALLLSKKGRQRSAATEPAKGGRGTDLDYLLAQQGITSKR